MKDYAAVDRERRSSRSDFPRALCQRRAANACPIAGRAKGVRQAVALFESLIAANPAGRLEQPGLENRYLLAVSYEGLKRYEDALAALLPVVDNAKGQLKADAQLTQDRCCWP